MKPTYEQIAKRAYTIYEREGRPEGRADVHWRVAEAELITELALAGLTGRAVDAPPRKSPLAAAAARSAAKPARTPPRRQQTVPMTAG